MSGVRPERVKKRMDELGIGQSELARQVGIAQPSIFRVLQGDTKQPRFLHGIARALQTSTAYLLGETDDPSSLNSVADRQLPYRGQETDTGDLVEIDQIDLRYGMGATYADSHVEVEKRQFSREWLRSFTRASPTHLTWALGDGDSMEPTIRSGEVILIDRSQDTPLMGDGIWACAIGEIGMIKRLRHLPGGTVELHSDNPHVPPQLTADGELHVVGRVIAVVRKL